MPRWVMVDDTDPGIKYTGDWSAVTGTLDSSGNWGPPYLSTLHGTQTQGSFSYSFSGSALTLTGAIQVPRSSSSANTTWQCLIDGTSITVDDPADVENRVEFCAGSGLTDGPHTLQVNAKGSSSQTFWFDHLQYQPSASVSLANAAIYIDMTDPMWSFGTGWNPVFPGYMTNQTGAKVDFEFNGVSFKWYGFYDARFPFAVSTASYSIDGADPVNFSLNGVSAQKTSVQYSQVFFTTNTVSPGNHKVEIVYNGNANTTPLTVEAIVIQNGVSSSGTSGGGSSSSPTPGGGTLGTGVPSTGSGSIISTSTPVGAASVSTSGGSTAPTSSLSGGTSASVSAPSGSASSGSASSGSASSGSASNVSAPNDLVSNASKSNTGAIVGGVVGGIAVLLLAAFLFFWMFRRRKYSAMTEVEGHNTVPQPYFDHPAQRDMYSPVSVISRGGSHGSAPYDSQSHTESSGYPPTTPVPFQLSLMSSHGPRSGKGFEPPLLVTRVEAPRVVQEFPPTSTHGLRSEKGVEPPLLATRVEAPQVVQDVDSGIRMMAVHGDNSELLHVLPPVYSQT